VVLAAVELSVSDTVEESGPSGGIEAENWAGRILRIPDENGRWGFGDFYAVSGGTTTGAFVPF
jgi:hypothetical protein